MPYSISDLEQGDATLWRWLQEATGQATAPALAAMAGIDATHAGDASLAIEDRNKLYYLYMLIHEMQQRLHPAIVPAALEMPLNCDWTAEEESWRIRYQKEDYYYRHYLRVKHGVEEDFGCLLSDNPYTLMAAKLDGRTPEQLLTDGEWDVVWHAIVETPCIHPRLSGHYGGKWNVEGWQVPYSGDSSWRPENDYHWLVGDNTWELDGQYEKIDAKLKKLFPHSEVLLQRWETSNWSEDELRGQVEQMSGCPIELLIGPKTDTSSPAEDGHGGDHFLVARYTWLRALLMRDRNTPNLLNEKITCRPEPDEWLDGQRDNRELTLKEALKEERWVALWQFLDDLPWRYLPRVTLHKDKWVYEDECFLSDYPIGGLRESYFAADEATQEWIQEEYPILKRLFYVEPFDLDLFGMGPGFLDRTGIQLREDGSGGLSVSVDAMIDLDDLSLSKPVPLSPMPAEAPDSVIAVELRDFDEPKGLRRAAEWALARLRR